MWASGGRRGYLDTSDNMKLLEGYDKVAAYRAAHGYNSAGILIQTSSLVIVASNVPNKDELLGGMKGVFCEYDYENSTPSYLIELVGALVQQNEGPFGSVALLCNNSGGSAVLRLSASMVFDERVVADTDVMQVLEAIGNSVRPKGRVDLLGCRLNATAAGKAFLSKLTKQCGVQFAAKDDKRMVMGGGFGGTGGPSSPRAPVADTLAELHGRQPSVDNLVGAHSPGGSPSAGKPTPIVEPPMVRHG